MPESLAFPIVCIIATRINKEGIIEILMQKRTKDRKHVDYYGFWELPQGRIRTGETIADAAARELKEETGLTITKIAPQHKVVHLSILESSIDAFFPLLCIFDLEHNYIGLGIVVEVSGHPQKSSEASSHTWVDKDTALEIIHNNLVFPLNVLLIKQFFSIE